jgi:hypothetical protein
MKLNKSYYRPGSHHLCRVCDTPIAKLVDGKLRPLASKTHVTFVLENGSFYRTNLCKNCANDIDFRDQAIVQSFWANDLHVWEQLEIESGSTPTEARQKTKERATVKPIKGFCHVDRGDGKDLKHIVRKSREFVRDLKRNK